MTIEELKRALVEVRDMCRNTCCVKCPLHKMQEDAHIPYCPLYEDEDGMTVCTPVEWDIADWKEEMKE